MTELILGAIIIVLIAYHAFTTHQNNREKAKLINALIAKTSQDFINSEMTDKVKPLKPEVEKKPEMTAVDQLDDDEWSEAIKKDSL